MDIDFQGLTPAIDYSDYTPDVIFALDALGRITNEAQGTLAVTNGIPSIASPIRLITHTHEDTTLLPESDTHALGGLTRTLVRAHDDYGRPELVAAASIPTQTLPISKPPSITPDTSSAATAACSASMAGISPNSPGRLTASNTPTPPTPPRSSTLSPAQAPAPPPISSPPTHGTPRNGVSPWI